MLGDPDAGHSTVKLTPELQGRDMHLDLKAFFPAATAWGRRGYTVILLAATTSAIVGDRRIRACRRLAVDDTENNRDTAPAGCMTMTPRTPGRRRTPDGRHA
jgi:hypothetical protein